LPSFDRLGTRQAALQVKVEKTTPPPPPKKGRDNSLPPAALPSSTAPSASGPTVSTKPPSPTVPSAVTPSTSSASAATPVSGTVTLDIIYGLLCDVKSQVDRLSARQDRMEDQLRDVYNDTVGIRHESRQLVDCTKEAKERIGELTVVAEKIKEQLPRPPKGPQYDIYEGWTEERVAEIRMILFLCSRANLIVPSSKHPLSHTNREIRKSSDGLSR
ncbi:hypothetical protein PENTCL1PPCAC_14981, partial [Pristionchus entomophagus]